MGTSKIKWSEIFIFKGGGVGIFIIVLCLSVSAFLGLQVPRQITELGRQYEDMEKFYQVLRYLLVIFVLVYINRVIYQLTVNKFVQLLVQHIRHICYKRWLLNYEMRSSGKNRQDRYPMGEVLSRLINDTESVRELITSGTFGILIDLFFVISCLISFVMINTTSGLFLSGAQVFAAALLIWGSRYMRVVFLSVRQSRGHMYKEVANIMGGLSESFYTDHKKYASKKCVSHFDDFLNKQLKANVWDASYYSVAESLYPILLALVVLIFPYSQITEAAIILAIVDLIQRSIGPIKDIASKIASVQRAVSGFQRLGEFLGDLQYGASSPEEKIDKELKDFRSLIVNIKHFSYSSEQDTDKNEFALRDIHFTGHKGELLGLVGLSGSGKSTLLNIISGNIIPTQADIVLSCHACNDIHYPGKGLEDIIAYREQVGIVSQDSHIFSESMAFNITMQEDTPEDFSAFWEEVCSQIPYVLVWMPDPTQKVSPAEMSLGQKQLVAALRACYLKKTIVLFDEISSGLDSKLELALRKSVLLVQKNSLTIIVAHRLETIIQSDQIIVMENGRLVSSGKHQDLIKSSNVYQEFIKEISHSA